MKFYKVVRQDEFSDCYRSLYSANPQVYEVGKETVCDNMFLYREDDEMCEYLRQVEDRPRFLVEVDVPSPYMVSINTALILCAIYGHSDYKFVLQRALADSAWSRNVWMCDKLTVVRVLGEEEANRVARGACDEVDA